MRRKQLAFRGSDMPDRSSSILVTLDESYRDDDLEELKNAISLFMGVLKVELVNDTCEDFIKKQTMKNQVQIELVKALYKIVKEQ